MGRLLSLTYQVELDKIEKHLDDNIKYLDHHYDLGHFLASGRKVPRSGGVILANVHTREILDDILSEDPFKLNDIADYDIIEFIPTKTSKELSHLKQS
ncbi:GTP cyclohydrolase [Vibrio sp. S11_S32]|nr:GTP cyclohydrolase [Vibrio sp. S11_S32]